MVAFDRVFCNSCLTCIGQVFMPELLAVDSLNTGSAPRFAVCPDCSGSVPGRRAREPLKGAARDCIFPMSR